MKNKAKAILILAILLSPLTGQSEGKKSDKTQKVTFEGSDIDGQARTPEGAFLNPKKGVKFMPLYKVTNELDNEIKNSVDFVR
jgi:hypothetical protein